MRKKNSINYVHDYQSDCFLEKKTIFEYCNTSASQFTCFSSSFWRPLFCVCLFELFIIWKGCCVVPWLVSQWCGFTWQFPLAGHPSSGTQGGRETWRSFIEIVSDCVEPWDLAEQSGAPEMDIHAENSWQSPVSCTPAFCSNIPATLEKELFHNEFSVHLLSCVHFWQIKDYLWNLPRKYLLSSKT